MNGLYQRALDYLNTQQRLRLVRSDDTPEGEFDGTPEERAQIEGEIRAAVESNQIQIGPETFRVHPERRGGALPLLVNLIALLLIAGGVYILLQIFDNQERTLTTSTSAIVSTEGRLLSALREESAAQLSEKESEIAEIERRLERAEAEREQVRAETASRLDERETELRAEFQAELEAERERLARQDLTEEQRADQLDLFREQRAAELETAIASVQAEADSALREQEQAINSVLNEYEASLAEVRAERQSLESELADRQEELQSQFQQREVELSDERAAAVNLLEELQAQQEQQRRILDQILSVYVQVRERLAAGELDEASIALENLRTYLQQGSIAEIPELQRRRQVELFLIDTLEARINQSRNADSADTRTLVESAGLIAEVAELTAQGEASLIDGNLQRARELYTGALARIPAVALGYERLNELEAQLAAEESQRIAGLVSDGNELYRGGDYQAAAARYGEALATLPAPDDQLLTRILDAGYQLQASDSLAELERLRDDLTEQAQQIAASEQTIETQQEELGAQTGTIADLRSQLRTVDDLVEAREAEAGELETELETLREEYRSTQSVVEELRTRLDSTSRTLADAESVLDASRSDIAERDALIAGIEGQLVDAQEQFAESQAEVSLLRARRAEQARLVEEIETYRQSFARAGDEADEQVSSLELLEAKLLILRIVGSGAVRAEYPDLYDELNAYLDALVAEQRADAVQSTLGELDSLLAEVADSGRTTVASIDALASDYPNLASPLAAESAETFLSRLERLLTRE